jgi:hypothetical protein
VSTIQGSSSIIVSARLKWIEDADTPEDWTPIPDASDIWTPVADTGEIWNRVQH